MRKIIRVDICKNTSCRFNIGRQCITQPEVKFENGTCECVSNTDDWIHFIAIDDIIEDDEDETFG